MYLTRQFIYICNFFLIFQISYSLAKGASNCIPELQHETFELRLTEEVNQTQVLERLRQHPNITNLILHSVQNPFVFRENVELTNLKNFVLIFQNDFNYSHSFWINDTEVGSRLIEAGFPFTQNGRIITLNNIVNTGINVEVGAEFDSNPILKINHTTSEIDSRYTSVLNRILSEGNSHGFKKLGVGIYSCSQEPLNVPLIPDTIEHLELDAVELRNGTLDDLLKKLTQLKNLYMDFHQGSGHFSVSSLPKSLQSVFLYNIERVEYIDGTELPNLESLYLYAISTLDPKVIQNFDKIFPYLKYIVLWEYSLELLPKLASISSMEEISIAHSDSDRTALATNDELQKQFGPTFINCVLKESLCYLKKMNGKWMIEPPEDLTSRFHFDRITIS